MNEPGSSSGAAAAPTASTKTSTTSGGKPKSSPRPKADGKVAVDVIAPFSVHDKSYFKGDRYRCAPALADRLISKGVAKKAVA